MIYLDTSAFVKKYHDEEGSVYVHEIFKMAKEGKAKLLISLWTISETIDVLDRHRMRKELEEEEFEIVIGAILSDILELEEKEVVDIETDLVRMSWDIIIKEHLSASDALHMVTAMIKRADRFLAADKRFVSIAKNKGLEAINVEIA